MVTATIRKEQTNSFQLLFKGYTLQNTVWDTVGYIGNGKPSFFFRSLLFQMEKSDTVIKQRIMQKKIKYVSQKLYINHHNSFKRRNHILL